MALAMSRDSLTRWLNSFTERVSFRVLVMEGDGGRRDCWKSRGDNGNANGQSLTSEARVDVLKPLAGFHSTRRRRHTI